MDSLLKDGYAVTGIDDYSAGKSKNLESAMESDKFFNIKADVCSDRIGHLFDGVDVVFHNAASKKNICLNNPKRDLDVNGGGTLNLLQLCLKHGVKKFVHASTGSVYGEAKVFPQDENHPLNPCSYYGVSKLAGERYVAMFNSVYGLDATILRYFHVFGSRQDSTQDRGGVVSIFTNKIINGQPVTVFGTGDQQRSFTHVSDVVGANRFVADNHEANGQVYNVASGLKISIWRLIDAIEKITGKSADIKMADRLVGDIDRFDISSAKIRSLGFQFNTNFEENIREMCDCL